MSDLRPAATLYILALGLATTGLTAFLLVRTDAPSQGRLSLSLIFVGLMTAVVLFPMHWDFKTKLTLDLCVIFAATLIFEPGLAMLVVGSGTVLAQAVRREPWEQTLFNTSQSMLQAGAGGIVLASAGWRFERLVFTWPESVVVLVAAGVVYAVNTLLLSVMVQLQSHYRPLTVLRELSGFDAVGLLSQLALGVLAAVLADGHPWLLPALLPPALAVYRSTERNVRLREQAVTLEHQAFHDSLTGLPNRALFTDRLEHALARTARNQSPVAVLFLDLDRFKAINDSLGHDVGDEVLAGVAQRLRTCMRPADTVARYGGDEFVFLLEDLVDPSDAMGVAERVSEALRAPFNVRGREVSVRTSVGIAFKEAGRDSAARLLRDSDVAMYKAKAGGAGHYEVFDSEAGFRGRAAL